MIEVSHLCKRYRGIMALDDVSFSVQTGSICGLLGPNGAGKSTTMNIMCGCLAASSGEVRYDGKEIYADMREAKREIGYLPEIPPLYTEMTPREYLLFVAGAKELGAQDARGNVDELMQRCGLTEVSERIIMNLSKGYRQRVGIAAALVGNPRFVVLDEPTVGLDPIQIVEIRELIRSLAPEHTVLVSSHILSEIRSICDRIVMISHGKLVADDTPENLEHHAVRSSSLTILVEAAEETVHEALDDLEGIANMQISPGEDKGTVSVVLEGAADVDLRASASRALAMHGALILGMARKKASLEDAFIELAGSGAPASAPAVEPTASVPEQESESKESQLDSTAALPIPDDARQEASGDAGDL